MVVPIWSDSLTQIGSTIRFSTFERVSACLPRRWHRSTARHENDQDEEQVPIRSQRGRRPQKRRMIPTLATTLCWVLELSGTGRFGLPDKKSRTSPRRPMKRNSR
jgi:hypothetical protein